VVFCFKLRETPQFHRRKPFLLNRISHVLSIKIKAVCFMNCKALTFYDTGVITEYGDQSITLSTCEYSRQGNRLVVVAKKV